MLRESVLLAPFENDVDADGDGWGDSAARVVKLLKDLDAVQFAQEPDLKGLNIRLLKADPFPPRPKGAEAGSVEGHEMVRRWMAENGVELMIWGRVEERDGERVPVVQLTGIRWQGRGARPPVGYTLELRKAWMEELGVILHLALVAEGEKDGMVPAKLRIMVKHAQKLFPPSNELDDAGRAFLDSIGPRNRAEMRWILGNAERRLGQVTGDRAMQERAVSTLKEGAHDFGPAGRIEASYHALDLGLLILDLGEAERDKSSLQFAGILVTLAARGLQRERFPMDWALAVSYLGDIHSAIADITPDVSVQGAYWEEAVSYYREALSEYTREKAPRGWADTQMSMGIAFARLGELQRKKIYLVQAITASKEALRVHTRKDSPEAWASVMNNLASALVRLGEYEGETARLEEAVAVFREVLLEYTRKKAPEEWAMTQTNLGVALTSLGEREEGTQHLEAAVEALELALQERTRERSRIGWGMTQNNLGTAWRALGVRTKNRGLLCKALDAHLKAWDAAREVRAVNLEADWGANAIDDLNLLGASDSGKIPACEPPIPEEWLRSLPRKAP